MQKNIIDDGFNPEFVETAFFDGLLEIPRIDSPSKIVIPNAVIPFSQRKKCTDQNAFIAFYEYDVNFADVLRDPTTYDKEFKEFQGIITLDNSVYIDSPLIVQMANVYRSRAIGHYYQECGHYVIPNVRWGDERSYTTCVLPEKFAFLGLPKHSIVSIGTYGCAQSKEEKYHLRNGLVAMLDELEPEIVLVYGPMNEKIFSDLKDRTRFINYPDWTSSVKGRVCYGNK